MKSLDRTQQFSYSCGAHCYQCVFFSSRSFNVTSSIIEETTHRTPVIFRDRGKTASHRCHSSQSIERHNSSKNSCSLLFYPICGASIGTAAKMIHKMRINSTTPGQPSLQICQVVLDFLRAQFPESRTLSIGNSFVAQ